MEWEIVGEEEAAKRDESGSKFLKFKSLKAAADAPGVTSFIGRLVRREQGNAFGKPVTLYFFETPAGEKELTPGKDLGNRLTSPKVAEGMIIRIDVVDEKDTGQASPMLIYKVGVAKAPAAAPKPGVGF